MVNRNHAKPRKLAFIQLLRQYYRGNSCKDSPKIIANMFCMNVKNVHVLDNVRNASFLQFYNIKLRKEHY